MIERSQVLHFLERAKARVEGADPAPGPEADTVRYARDRLEDAVTFAHAGTELPPGTRLRPVKAAVLAAVRPVTSHQEPFNLQVLAALDGLTDAVERLSHRVGQADRHVSRMQSTVATTDVTVDGVTEDVRRLAATVDELVSATVRLDAARTGDASELRAELADLRAELADLRDDLDAVRTDLQTDTTADA